MALTSRNLHNFNAEKWDLLNDEIYRVLKSGGLYGVIDHTRRHIQSDNSENWRHMDFFSASHRKTVFHHEIKKAPRAGPF
jgi:predicted methyltransferase